MSRLTDRVLRLLPDARLHSEDDSGDVIVWGPPGTGKTTSLRELLRAHLKFGEVPPDRFLVNAFTRNATGVLRSRLFEEFGIEQKDMPWVRTIHSSCFQLLSMQTRKVVGPRELRRFGEECKWTFKGVLGARSLEDPYGASQVVTLGDWCYVAEELRRQRCAKFREVVAELFSHRPPWAAAWNLDMARDFSREYKDWKRENGLYDFADMLELVLHNQITPPITQMFVDEAQDNTTLVWRVIDLWRSRAERLFIFGDDDQALYEWSGADPRGLWSRRGSQFVLSHSYRLPSRIHASAQRLIRRTKDRVVKDFEPDRAGGQVDRVFGGGDSGYDGWELVEWDRPGSYLALCRNRAFMGPVRDYLRSYGYAFKDRTKPDAGSPDLDSPIGRSVDAIMRLRAGEPLPRPRLRALRSMLRSGLWPAEPTSLPPTAALVDLPSAGAAPALVARVHSVRPLEALELPATDLEYLRLVWKRYAGLPEPQIELSTIHGVKGEEADNVIVSTSMTNRTYQEYLDYADPEHRVFYVGGTRARHTLTWRVDGGKGYVI